MGRLVVAAGELNRGIEPVLKACEETYGLHRCNRCKAHLTSGVFMFAENRDGEQLNNATAFCEKCLKRKLRKMVSRNQGVQIIPPVLFDKLYGLRCKLFFGDENNGKEVTFMDGGCFEVKK
jgi:hypothetical protein